MRDTIKISSNAEKVTTPGKKQVWRITRASDGKSEGDYVTFSDERPDLADEIYMFHPLYTYINKNVRDFNAKPLLTTIFNHGELVYDLPSLAEIKAFSKENLFELWDEYKRDLNPQPYPVDLSQELWNHKMRLISQVRTRISQQKLD